MRGKGGKGMDGTYQGAEKEQILKPIEELLDKHRLKRYELNDKGEKILDDEGEPVLVGMTLAGAVRRHNDRRISNLEMLQMGRIPILTLTKRDVSVVRLITRDHRLSIGP